MLYMKIHFPGQGLIERLTYIHLALLRPIAANEQQLINNSFKQHAYNMCQHGDQTKLTAGGLYNPGGVATVAAHWREQGVLQPAERRGRAG